MTCMKKRLVLLCFLFAFNGLVMAQSTGPVDHMNALSEREEALRKKYMSYISTVAHSRSARKMEKRRTDLLREIQNNIREGGRLAAYKGDASLRNAYVEYWKVLLHLFKEDYQKIVDMEEVIERSYDEMEAYLLLQEKIDEKMRSSFGLVSASYNLFAANHQVRLLSGETSKLDEKLKRAGEVSHYVNQVYLVYFKSTVQENKLLDALNNRDLSAIEQLKSAVAQFSEEGLSRLDTFKTFHGDGSLINACRNVLEFQRDEVENKIPALTGFLLKADEFDKMKKSFEAIPAARRTQDDVDNFNRAVKEYNDQIPVFNKNSSALFSSRNKVMEQWEASRKRFIDMYTPYK